MALAALSETGLPGLNSGRIPDLRIADREFALVDPLNVGALIVVHERVDATILDHFPQLRVVARYGIGYDSVDVAACTERGIQVGITPGPVDHSTAELTIALILAAQWDLCGWVSRAREATWSRPMNVSPSEIGVYGSKVGLLGAGRVGLEVGRRLIALGAEVKYFSRFRNDEAEKIGLVKTDLLELLSDCDVVSVHLPLNESTRDLIGSAELALMRDGALFVNTARGAIVDERALLGELSRLRVAADAFWDEPTIPRQIRAATSALITPHIGSQLRGTRLAMTELVEDNVLAGLAGRRVPHGIPEQAEMRIRSI